jgi:hypothetical protein
VILLHMIEIMDHGIYANITAMDIYSIMYCYDECSNELQKNHSSECLCKKMFTEGNSSTNLDSYGEIRKSIRNHYAKIQQIQTIYRNYQAHIATNYKSKLTYNVNQSVKFKMNEMNFKMLGYYQILAYSDECVIHFIFKPQFNKLNFGDVMVDAIFNNFMLGGSNDERGRYQNKKFVTCILSLDSNKPIFYEFDTTRIHNNLILYTKEYLLNKFTNYHTILHEFYNYCYKNRPEFKSGIEHTYNELSSYQSKISRLPTYMVEYFHTINTDIDRVKGDKKLTDEISNRVVSKELFLDMIRKDLEKAINNYLDIGCNKINYDY